MAFHDDKIAIQAYPAKNRARVWPPLPILGGQIRPNGGAFVVFQDQA
eukprot:SAG31_NODE_29414_length_394_cov_2.094595_1_plen_46_part_01